MASIIPGGSKPRAFSLTAMAFSLLLLISGCGQKGDLYLPDSKSEAEVPTEEAKPTE